MSILVDVAKELFGMFVADMRLALGVLALVALVAILVDFIGANSIASGVLLLIGSLLIVVEAAVREARN